MPPITFQQSLNLSTGLGSTKSWTVLFLLYDDGSNPISSTFNPTQTIHWSTASTPSSPMLSRSPRRHLLSYHPKHPLSPTLKGVW